VPAQLALVAEAADRDDVRIARRRLVLAGVLSVTVLAVFLVVTAHTIASRYAHDDSAGRAAILAAVAASATTADDVATRALLDQTMPSVAREQSVRHVVVWESDGVVLWSEDDGLIGRRFSMEPRMQALFTQGGAFVSGPGGDSPESAPSFAGADTAFEVFTLATSADGRRLVVEAYVEREAIDRQEGEFLALLLPVALAALVLVQASSFMSATLLMRHVQRARKARTQLVNRAMLALEAERRELAGTLHDGVVQDLAAMRYALSGVVHAVAPDTPGDPRRTLERVCEVLGDQIVALRGMLGDLVTPDVESSTLDEALHAVARNLVPPEIRCHVRVEVDDLTPRQGQTIYRVVREGVVNAVKHGPPTSIGVAVTTAGPLVVVEVLDDGPGPGHAVESTDGHVGLDLLRALVRDELGTLRLIVRQGGGAHLLVTLPHRQDQEGSRPRRVSTGDPTPSAPRNGSPVPAVSSAPPE
jgi:signal transduction histidine kinase